MTWLLNNKQLEIAAECLESLAIAQAEVGDDEVHETLETARTMRKIARAALQASEPGPQAWPGVMVFVNGIYTSRASLRAKVKKARQA